MTEKMERITIRLPESVVNKIRRMAKRDGILKLATMIQRIIILALRKEPGEEEEK